MRVGRNDPCSCGSGKKFKNCCAGRSSGISKGVIALIVVIVTIAVIGLLPSLLGGKPDAAAAARRAPTSPRQASSQSGRVWSQEHGHWHDASGQAATAPVAQTSPSPQQQQPNVVTVGNTPQPPGPVPAGQVWSTEHGHWHAAPK